MPSWNYTEEEVRQRLEEQQAGMVEEICWAMHATTSDPFPLGTPTNQALRDWYARHFGKAVPPELPIEGSSKGKAQYDNDDDTYSPHPPNRGREFNVGHPGEYDGSHNGLQTWVTQVEGVVVSFTENYQNENKLLDGSIYYTNTFQKFVKRLKATFESGDQTMLAILHLSDIKQGTRKLEAYIAKFTGLVNKAQLKEELCEAGIFFLIEWIKVAGEAHMAIATRHILEGKESQYERKYIHFHGNSQDPNAMDIDTCKQNMHQSGSEITHNNCQEKGHYKHDCKKKQLSNVHIVIAEDGTKTAYVSDREANKEEKKLLGF
ncbi:hypothetical protein M404DRAFT_31615 [Pisolithus tinctorius Marx 270]|uniref:Retrotransposon gag domain-containing protein n=1 Tax=Pisolithus tinctorius Marx 270 TaxID=870435 RepID=A0A0C3NRZ5_PISTI|nr:hypothetical protein M404DRAFT_31615 [Pisolithus tinctorius Marx 270]